MVRLGNKRRNGIDVADSGALSDLAFLLIVFFIVIAVFNVNSGFLLGLPQKGAVTPVFTDDLMRVTVTADDRFIVYEKEASLDEVRSLAEERRRLQPNMTLVVSMHPQSTYQSLVSLVETARVLDIDNFSFSLRDGDSP